MRKTAVKKALLKDIKRFCKEKDLVFNKRLMTINNKKKYLKNGRFFYLENKVDVMKDYYKNNKTSTFYSESNIINHYKFAR